MTPEQEKRIREIYQEEFNKNYVSGATRIPPHRHTGVDNLQIDAKDILNLPAGSGPGGSDGQVQFNDGGAFGGSDQFTYSKDTGIVHLHDIDNRLDSPNDTFELGIASINGQRLLLTTNNIDTDGNILGSTADIYMATGFTTVNNNTGAVDILTGIADDAGNVSNGTSGHINLQTGTSNKQTGAVSLISGDVTGNPSPNAGKSGDVTIQSGFAFGDAGDVVINGGVSAFNNSGSILLTSGAAGSGTPGDITLVTNGNGQFISTLSGGQLLVRSNGGPGSSVQIEATDSSSGMVNLVGGTDVNATAPTISITSPAINNGVIVDAKVTNIGYQRVGIAGMFDFDGTITIADRLSGTPITGSPTGGGMLYSEGGALYWLGSSGTLTMIAPA